MQRRNDGLERSLRDASASRTTFRPGIDTIIPIRSFRASSYDSFTSTATKSAMPSSHRTERTAYSRPSYSGMSQSYHDYSTPTRSCSNRYGSTEQLYRSPYVSSSGHGGSSTYHSNSSFTKSGSVGFSLPEASSRSYREYGSTTSYSNNSSSAPRYRTAYGSTISSFHQPRTNFDYRSKTPGYERDSRLCQVRYDRDSRSMSRSEKTPLSGSEDSDVEKAYQKLYNKYVKEDSDAANGNGKEGNVIQRPFTSQSETREGECSSEDDPAETRSSFSEILGIAQKWADTSLTTPVINDNSPDATPKCSPMMARKREPEPMAFSGQLPPAKETDKSDDKGRVGETLADSNAAPDQPHEQHSNFLVPTPTIKTTTSTMDHLLQRDSLTTNLSEVVERKKSSIGAPRNGDGVVSETPSRSVSPNIASVQCNQNGAGIQILLNEAFATHPNTNATNSNLSSKNSPKRGSSPNTDLPPPTSKVNGAVTNTDGSTESHHVSPRSSIANLLTENPTSKTKYVKSTDFAESNDHRIQSEERSWAKGSDINLDQKNKNYQNTDPSGLVNSSTEKQQELRLTSNELSTNITVPLVVLEKVPRSGSVSPSLSTRKGVKESTPSHQSDPHISERRKRRDPARTLENLNGKLQTGEKSEEQNAATKQMLDSIKNQENGNGSNMTNKSLLPTVLVTEPSKPSTMIKTTAQAVEESTDGDWTETEDEAEYESDYEYSVSQTFSLKDALPIGDLYPLSRSSSRCSPFISDYDSDASMPLFMLPSREAESRGRVDRLFAFPAPSFTCSITYDGQESWDEESLHSCAEYDEEYYGRLTRSSRPGSSALGAYLSPAAFSSDEDFDGTHFHEEVDVGCTLRLVDKAAMRADNYEDSEYYDEEEYSDEECWDENGEYHEDEAYGNHEESEDEEKEVTDVVDEMRIIEESLDEKSTDSRCPLAFSQPAEVECDINFEEMNDEFEVGMTIELAVPQLVKKPLEYPETHREVTYIKDLQLLTEDGEAETLSIEQQESAKAVKKRIIKDGTSEKVTMSRIPQCVAPIEETAAVDESTALPDEEVHQLHPQHHEDDKSRHDVTVVPTYVRPQAETIKEESASRFSNKKATTDFARKAVIQPPKLHTAAVQQVETKTAPKQQTSARGTRTKESPEPEMSATIAKEPMTKNYEGGSRLYVETLIIKGSEEGFQSKNVEDKSAVRKSALNMSLEEAKHKATVDEETAKQKARRFGTVSSLLNRFKEPELKEEPITYKRSCYLGQQEVERPKKQYNIVKPAINDNFDKQMEEIRAQMKSGSSHFQNSVKDLSKGITLTSEGIKKRAEEEKKKIIMDSVSGVFSKADEENARWKEKRDAETEKELAKIEAEKDRKKKVVVPEPKTELEKPAEPKRVVRKIFKDKSSAVQQTKADDSLALSTGKAAETSSKPATASAINATTEPKSSRAPISMERPKIPQTENVVNVDNYDLFEAATNVATRCRKSLVELRNQREQDTTTKAGMDKENEAIMSSARVGPKGDGAVATKIRNAIGNFTNLRKTDSPTLKTATEKSPKRYATRRKTQEIVNESTEPKVKKRKQTYKRSKFIRDPHDIDVLLGWDKENTFEKMDQMFSRAAKDLINGLPLKKRKRVPSSKIWISDLTDIDKIYSTSEIRDIIASANA